MSSGGGGREDVLGGSTGSKEGACEWSLSHHVVRTTRVSFRGRRGPWLPGTLTSRDLSCALETGLAGERYRGGRRAFLQGVGWGGRWEEQQEQRHGRKNESAARWGMAWRLHVWNREFLRGDGGSDDWIAKVGPDLGFECPTEEHSTQLLPRDFRSRLNYLKGHLIPTGVLLWGLLKSRLSSYLIQFFSPRRK